MNSLVTTLLLACFQALPQNSSTHQFVLLDESEVVRNGTGQVTQVSLRGDTETIIGKLKSLANMKPSEAIVESITISQTVVTAELSNELKHLDRLQCLRIGDDSGAAETFVEKEAYEAFSQLQQLLELHIVDAEYHKFGSDRQRTGISFLSSLKKLRVLEIDANISADDFQIVASLPALSDFTYHRDAGELPNDSWAKLLHNPNLRVLTLPSIGPGFSPARVFQDSAGIKLEFLYIGYVDPKSEWANEDIRAIGKLSNLKTLSLPSSKPMSEAQLLALVPCEQIEEITIFLQDKVISLPFLSSNRSLRKLSVYAPEFVAFEDLAGHPTLVDLTLGSTFTIKALGQLSNVPSLRRLSVFGNKDLAAELRARFPSLDIRVCKPECW